MYSHTLKGVIDNIKWQEQKTAKDALTTLKNDANIYHKYNYINNDCVDAPEILTDFLTNGDSAEDFNYRGRIFREIMTKVRFDFKETFLDAIGSESSKKSLQLLLNYFVSYLVPTDAEIKNSMLKELVIKLMANKIVMYKGFKEILQDALKNLTYLANSGTKILESLLENFEFHEQMHNANSLFGTTNVKHDKATQVELTELRESKTVTTS